MSDLLTMYLDDTFLLMLCMNVIIVVIKCIEPFSYVLRHIALK